MSARRLYLDAAPGERRGVVTRDGRPERLLIERDGDASVQALGAQVAGQIRRVDPTAALAFVDLGEGPDAVINLAADLPPPVEGALVAVEIRSQARRGKGATVRRLDLEIGARGLIAPGPTLEARLRGFGDGEMEIIDGADARAQADAAQEAVMAIVHPLPGGGSLSIETTRALAAVDVDLGAGVGSGAKQAARTANLAAISVAARLLRLKGLGGLIVIDLVGRRHDGVALMTAARSAFAADNPGVAFAPLSRFGTLELAVPRRDTPAWERLTDADGGLNATTLAMGLIRALEREATADPGGRFEGVAAPEVIQQANAALAILAGRLGARLILRADPAFARDRIEVRAP